MRLIYGINPLREALSQSATAVERVFIQRGSTARDLEKMAQARGVPVDIQDKSFFVNQLGAVNHQGVAGIVRDFQYAKLDDIIAASSARQESTLLILDEITDPQNMGALIRVADCGGIDGIIIPEKRACPITPTVVKISAGAVFFSQIAAVTNLAATIDALKERGFWIYGAQVGAPTRIGDVDFADKSALVLGSEGRGIRRLIAQKCDVLFSIPMRGNIGSLNVAVAAGIIIYERGRSIYRKKR